MKKIAAVIFAFIFLFGAPCWAAPSITSQSGTVKDGQSVTIGGSSFGSGGAPTQWLGGSTGNIEAGTPGNSFSGVGWTDAGGFYSSVRAHSYNKSILFDYYTISSNWIVYNTGEQTELYATFWANFNKIDSAYRGQWKPFRYNSSSAYAVTDENCTINDNWFDVNATDWSYNPSHLQCYRADNTSTTIGGWSATAVILNTWLRFEVHYKRNSGADVGDGVLSQTRVGLPTMISVSNANTHSTAVGVKEWEYWFLGLYYGNLKNSDGSAFAGQMDCNIYIDDVYMKVGSTALARVEIGDNAVFTSCAHREIQAPTSWADGGITFTANIDGFTPAEQEAGLYLFVVDSTGAASSGYRIQTGVVGVGTGPNSISTVAPGTPGSHQISINSN